MDDALGHRSQPRRTESSGPRDVHRNGPIHLVVRRSGRAVRHDDQPLAHVSELGRINASNPCSEYMFVDDSACNLASINLMKFRREDGVFDYERFQTACRLVFIAQEILVDHGSYPTRRIAANSHRFRPIGLGYSNLGSLIMTAGLAYDSDEARGLCGAVSALLHGSAYLASTELAAAVGPFDEYEKNREPMLHVMEMHWEKVDQIKSCPKDLQEAARDLWDKVLAHGKRHGFRNAQATVLAPTGTISFMMDCDTTGIEPDIALVKYKQLAGGGMLKIVNQTVPLALRTLGYDQPQVEAIIAYIDKHDTIEGSPDLKPRAPAGVRLCLSAAGRQALDPLAGAHPDDGRRPAVRLRGHLEDSEHAAGKHCRGRRPGLYGRLAAGAEGPCHLPRRVERGAAAIDEVQVAAGRGESRNRPAAGTPARYPPVGDAQVQRLGPRGLHHRGPLSRRPAGRAVYHHGQGGQHHRRADGLFRHGRVDELAVRRAAGGVRQQVLAHPLRADGLYEESPTSRSPRASWTTSSAGWASRSCRATARRTMRCSRRRPRRRRRGRLNQDRRSPKPCSRERRSGNFRSREHCGRRRLDPEHRAAGTTMAGVRGAAQGPAKTAGSSNGSGGTCRATDTTATDAPRSATCRPPPRRTA